MQEKENMHEKEMDMLRKTYQLLLEAVSKSYLVSQCVEPNHTDFAITLSVPK